MRSLLSQDELQQAWEDLCDIHAQYEESPCSLEPQKTGQQGIGSDEPY